MAETLNMAITGKVLATIKHQGFSYRLTFAKLDADVVRCTYTRGLPCQIKKSCFSGKPLRQKK